MSARYTNKGRKQGVKQLGEPELSCTDWRRRFKKDGEVEAEHVFELGGGGEIEHLFISSFFGKSTDEKKCVKKTGREKCRKDRIDILRNSL